VRYSPLPSSFVRVHPPASCASSPLTGWGRPPLPHAEGIATAERSPGSATTQHPTPGPSASPYAGVDDDTVRLAGSALVNTCPSLAGTQQQPNSTPAADLPSSTAPSWASIVRGGARVSSQPQPQPMVRVTATRDDYFSLNECCIAGSLRARIGMRHSAGLQEIYISCSLPTLSIAGHEHGHEHC
jgi:hypothetical protein